jgi:hypothetical protein
MATYYSYESGAFSSVGASGIWNTSTTPGARPWASGFPADVAALDNNQFIIQTGHVVEQDLEDAVACGRAAGDVSGWANGIAGITVQNGGELTLSRTANTTLAISDLACTDHTGPPFSLTSASNPFVASDSGALITIPAGGNWTGGVYLVTYVGAGEVTITVDPTNGSDGAACAATLANRVYDLPIKDGASCSMIGTATGKLTSSPGSGTTAMPTNATHVIQQLGTTTRTLIDATNLDVDLFCAPPNHVSYTVDVAAASGDNHVHVSHDPTGDPEWLPGREVRCNNVAQAQSSKVVTLASSNPLTSDGDGTGTITFTGTIGAAMAVGAQITLTQRNIEIRTNNAGIAFSGGTGAVLDCAIRSLTYNTGSGINGGTGHTVQGSAAISGFSNGINLGTGHTVQGSAVISGCYYGINSGTGHTVQGSAVISGCYYGISAGTGHTVQGSAVISGCDRGIYVGTGYTVQGSAVISGCYYGINSGTGHTVQGSAVISGCSSGIYAGTGHTVQGAAQITLCTKAIYAGCTRMRGGTLGAAADSKTCFDAQYAGKLICYGASLLSTTTVTAATRLFRNTAPGPRVELWDPGGVATKYPSFWCGGGYGLSATIPADCPDATLSKSLHMHCEQDALTPTITQAQHAACFQDFPIWFEKDIRQTITVYVRKTAATAFSGGANQEPTAMILDPAGADWPTAPTAVTAGAGDTTTLTASNLDTWQTLTLTYKELTRSRMLLLRFTFTYIATNSVDWAHTVAVAGASSGGWAPHTRRFGQIGVN